MALHFREHGRLVPTYQACNELIAQKRRDILLRPAPVAGSAAPEAAKVVGAQGDAKGKGRKRELLEADAPVPPKAAPPGAKPTGGYDSHRQYKKAMATHRQPGAPPVAAPPQPPRQQGYAPPPPWYYPPTPFHALPPPAMAPPPGYPPMPPMPPAGPAPPRAPVAACFDFARGTCTRGAACRFSHTPAA